MGGQHTAASSVGGDMVIRLHQLPDVNGQGEMQFENTLSRSFEQEKRPCLITFPLFSIAS